MPLGKVLREVAMQTGGSIVWAEELDESTVSVELEGVPADVGLGLIARRVGADLVVEDGVYYLGERSRDDNGILVRRVGGHEIEDIEAALSVVINEAGQAHVFPDGLVVVADQYSVLRRASELLEGLQDVGSGWVVQLLLVEEAKTRDSTMGVDTKFDLEVSTAFATSATTTEFAGEARAALRADIQRQAVSLYAQPLFLVRDGTQATIKRVQVVPIPQFTTLETGAVVTSGYSEVEIGFDARIALRAWGEGRAEVEYKVNLGEILGYVDERVPVRTQETLEGQALMQSGGTYLLGSLERAKGLSGRSGPAQLLFNAARETSSMEVWCMAVEVGPASAVTQSTDENFSVDMVTD